MALEEQIEKFCSYFSRQLIVMRSLSLDNDRLEGTGPEDQQIRFYQKVLIVTALDSLAGIRFPKKTYPEINRKNRERFIRFISEYSSWDDGVFINVPFLYDRLCKINARDENLAIYLREKLDRFNPQEGIDLSPNQIDELPEKLLSLAKSEKEEEAIWFNQHYSLLYRYRNFLIHESREPGYAMEGIREGEHRAFYHGYHNEEMWFLGYPVEMFFDLLENSINNLRAYFRVQDISPFEYIEETERW